MRDKEKRVIKSPTKYAYANLIAFALIALNPQWLYSKGRY